MWVEKHRSVWRIRESIGGVKVDLATGYTTKSAANDAMTIMRADALRGDQLIPRGGERTVAALCDDWWEEIGPTYTKVRSSDSMRGPMQRYIRRMLGQLSLRELEEYPTLVQRWVNDLSAGRTSTGHPLAPKTVRNAHGILHQILEYAIGKRLIRANPCRQTRLPEEVEVEQYYMTPAEADRLIAALPEYWRPLVLFLLATGCRWSEALGVRLKNLDVLGRKVRILKKWIEDEHGRFHEEDPKSKRGRRTVSFTTRVAQVLVPLTLVDDRDRHVFLTPRGRNVRHKEFYTVWHKARDEAGLKELRVHDLRHTHVAWLIAANVPMFAISRRLGHKNSSITEQEYGHLLEEVDERLVRALDEAMSIIDMGGIGGETAADDGRSGPVRIGETPAQ